METLATLDGYGGYGYYGGYNTMDTTFAGPVTTNCHHHHYYLAHYNYKNKNEIAHFFFSYVYTRSGLDLLFTIKVR